MAKMSLAEALTRFDRKERRRVVGRALGHITQLDQTFCEDVTDCLQIEPLQPSETEWFTDYHLDWLAGAFRVYALGEDCCLADWTPNATKDEARLISGTQQDVDLLLVRKLDVILIEAKWFGSWETRQLKDKLKRLRRLRDYAACLCEHKKLEPIRMHFLFMSPAKPPQTVGDIWASHSSGTPLPWLPMKAEDASTSALAVLRCDDEGKSKSDGLNWRVTRHGMPGSRKTK